MATKKTQGGASDDGADDGPRKRGEFRGGGEVRTALIQGDTFGVKAVQYVEIDGLAIFEGDIVLGTVDEVEQMSDMLRAQTATGTASGVGITGAQFRWPNCRVPFTIDPALPNQARVTDAIAHWQANTNYRFIARTTEADFVTFRPGSGCSAQVGRRTGQQFVNLAAGCSTGSTIHEIGHVIGLWHEQSREDRDSFVSINWPKITPGFEHNFNQHITDGDDIGAYDFSSIMHYPRNAFSIDGTDTITPLVTIPAGTVIGQRNGLSAGDIAAANSRCTPPVVKPQVKDLRSDTLKEQIHDTRKELIKDIRRDTRKEQILDTVKEQIRDTLKEQIRDTVKEGIFDPGPTLAENRTTPGRPPVVVNPLGAGLHGAVPFVVATPHHDDPSSGAGGGTQDAMGQLDAQLQEIAEQLAQIETARATLQDQFDETSALLAQMMQADDQSAG